MHFHKQRSQHKCYAISKGWSCSPFQIQPYIPVPPLCIALSTFTPTWNVRTDYSSNEWSGFLGWDFFFPFFFNSLLDSANQYDYVTCHTSPPAIIKEGTGTQPKLVGCAGLAILLLAHSQARLSWLWNCTFSSAAEPPSRMNVWGPFQGKKKTHRMTRYFWACSEKAVESTSPKKYFVRENYYHSLSSPWAVTYRFFGLVFLFWVCFVLFFSPPEKTRIRFLPSLYC